MNGIISLLIGLMGVACGDSSRFEKIDPADSGITFSNNVNPTPDLNVFNYLYFYNGGGVGAGDLNGDGLADLVFISNLEQNRVYLNQGNFKFIDISDRLGSEERVTKWSTGVSLADVNGDGRLDIYISEVGKYLKIAGTNKLYINQGNDAAGIPIFSEEGKQFGLDLVGFGTQAAFFDFDLDNDLDMYMLNHSVHSNGTFGRSDIRAESHPLAGDRFFRNDNGRFVDITPESGIYSSPLGYGLGIGISDINSDGYPDVYVGNDFHEDDYLYINNGDGTFTESLGEMLAHTSRFSMGNDLADVNNDGLVDILSLDMLPRDYEKLKTSAGEDAYDVYRFKLSQGYKDQFARNTLQLNRGNGKFSEIGLIAGIAASDWSWSGLLADFDLDGRNDVYIANGIVGRTNDMDYIKFMSNEAIQMQIEGSMTEQDLMLTQKMPMVQIPNYAFKNNGKLTFEDVSSKWGLDHESFSNGATYADLDNDGDLDIVTNNIGSEAFIYQNRTRDENPSSRYLTLAFDGPSGNRFGIGTKVETMLPGGEIIMKEMYPVRGYQSTVPHEIYIGLDSSLSSLQFLKITWPDGKVEEMQDVKLNQKLVAKYADASTPITKTTKIQNAKFTNVSAEMGLNHSHVENEFLEFNREALLPGMLSALGPAFAKGDLNGDDLDDFFVGGAKHAPSYIFVQQEDGTFRQDSLPDDPKYEDVDAAFFDFDQDGDLDLLVASGGNEFWGENEFLNPRIYVNDGGHFTRDSQLLNEVYINASALAVTDFDKDGDVDVFIGERAVPRKYGLAPQSILLVNEGGNFALDRNLLKNMDLGMVTDAKWHDMDVDGNEDLVVASEWSGIKILHQRGGRFELMELPNTNGLWNTLSIADLDGNNLPDIVGGNLGLNSKLATSGDTKIKMYVNDFDENGSIEQVITLTKDGIELFFANKDELMTQMNFIKKKYRDYKSFANASLADVFSEDKIREAKIYEVTDTRSAIFYQMSSGHFVHHALPREGQVAPVYEVAVFDYNGDSHDDLMLGGNFTRTTVQRGKYDASFGEIFTQDSSAGWEYVQPSVHGLYLAGEVRHIERLRTKDSTVFLVARNNGPIEVYSFNNY